MIKCIHFSKALYELQISQYLLLQQYSITWMSLTSSQAYRLFEFSVFEIIYSKIYYGILKNIIRFLIIVYQLSRSVHFIGANNEVRCSVLQSFYMVFIFHLKSRLCPNAGYIVGTRAGLYGPQRVNHQLWHKFFILIAKIVLRLQIVEHFNVLDLLTKFSKIIDYHTMPDIR
jgi:hypothetical protein